MGSKAVGCIWTLDFDDGTSDVIVFPSSSASQQQCSYLNGIYDRDDALQDAMYNLLRELDLDKDGLIDIKISEDGFSAQLATVSSVPYLWGPSVVEVRIWQ